MTQGAGFAYMTTGTSDEEDGDDDDLGEERLFIAAARSPYPTTPLSSGVAPGNFRHTAPHTSHTPNQNALPFDLEEYGTHLSPEKSAGRAPDRSSASLPQLDNSSTQGRGLHLHARGEVLNPKVELDMRRGLLEDTPAVQEGGRGRQLPSSIEIQSLQL